MALLTLPRHPHHSLRRKTTVEGLPWSLWRRRSSKVLSLRNDQPKFVALRTGFCNLLTQRWKIRDFRIILAVSKQSFSCPFTVLYLPFSLFFFPCSRSYKLMKMRRVSISSQGKKFLWQTSAAEWELEREGTLWLHPNPPTLNASQRFGIDAISRPDSF